MKELNKLYKLVDMDLVDIKDTYYSYNDFKIELLKELNNIKQALTPPTQEEICNKLSDELQGFVNYTSGEFEVNYKPYLSQSVCYIEKGNIYFGLQLPPHLITMIGKFYEGENK